MNISNYNTIEDNKDVLYFIGKNIEVSHQSFIKYYMDFKIELNEDFTKLYEVLNSTKITVNWEERLFHNDYNSELALIVYRILDSLKHEFNKKDIIDCDNLLLGKYINLERKKTQVYGNFIKLIYYFYKNYDSVLRKYFLSLELSFDVSLNNFSNQTTSVYIVFEVIALISFLLFLIINIFFLINSNKYIFQNILYMFADFSQTNNYSFNNKFDNLLVTKRVSNYILLLNEFTPKNLESLQKDKEVENINLQYMTFKNDMNEKANQSFIDIKNNNKVNNMNNKLNKKNKKFFDKKESYYTFINASLFNPNSNNLNNSNNNNNKGLKIINDEIHILNNKELNNISSNSINNLSNSRNISTNLLLNSSIVNSIPVNNSIININSNVIKNNNESIKNEEIAKISKNKIKKDDSKDNKIIKNELSFKKSENEEMNITLENVIFQTKIILLISIKILILIFIILTLIFIVYYIYKLVLSLLFISNFHHIISDFKILTSQYNHVIRYWNIMKTLFILPNTTIEENFEEIEEYFLDINSQVNYIYRTRIKRYKRISYLYDNLLSSSVDKNVSSIDFCMNHTRCKLIKESKSYLLLNGIESTVNLYAKEIFNYYKDFLQIKEKIKEKEDIILHFIDERYSVLSSNINHVIIYLEELAFNSFFKDEKDIVDNFYLKIKILNIVEICYCALLNLFSVLFVYNFITRIISSVEVASTRINYSIRRMKTNKME